VTGWELPAGMVVIVLFAIGLVVALARQSGKVIEKAKAMEAEFEAQERRRASRANRADDAELVDNFMSDEGDS
jgi:hypothetical protein